MYMLVLMFTLVDAVLWACEVRCGLTWLIEHIYSFNSAVCSSITGKNLPCLLVASLTQFSFILRKSLNKYVSQEGKLLVAPIFLLLICAPFF